MGVRLLTLLSLAVSACVLIGFSGEPTEAQEVACSQNSEGEYTCLVVAARVSPNRSVDIGGPSGPPLVWARTFVPDNLGAPPACERVVDTPAGPVPEQGRSWLITIRNSDTGQLVLVRSECQWSDDAPPDAPPPTPSVQSLVSDSDVGSAFALDTGLSPPQNRRGVSQLPTWLWCSNTGPVDVEATVLPHRASAQASVTKVTWTIDGPDGRVDRVAAECGSEPDIESDGSSAAAIWTPNEAGHSTITLTAEWSAQWTYTYFDPVLGAVDLGTFDLGVIEVDSEPISYEVYEIQSVGVGP